MAVSLDGPATVDRLVGRLLGRSGWTRVTPEMLTDFSAALGDSTTHIAQARLAPSKVPPLALVSVCPMLAQEIFSIDGSRYALNYGCDDVTFGSPVTTETSLRLRVELVAAHALEAGTQLRLLYELEAQGADLPVCRAHHLFRVIWH